jgi:thioredoxin reductase
VPARRVTGSASDAAGRLVTFTFDGHEVQGIEGEPLAASLLAADRPILSRSFRFHRPRGLMCSTGQCGWCECEVDGRPAVRSCRVPVREGLVARGEHALPSVDRDLLSLVGLVSRWIPPTFYHHRFLRPRRMRKRYLDVIRAMGGRGRLRPGPREPLPGRPRRQIEPDVLVVGGGRAGLLASLGAAEAGARVVLIEADRSPDERWRLETGTEPDPGPAMGGLRDAAAAAGVEILAGVTAAGWYDGMIAAIGDDAHLEIRAGAVVAATGSYERVPQIPGGDRPGVMAARTVAVLVERHGILPGERALLVGDGRELERAGELLRRAGGSIESGPVPTAALVSVEGERRVTGAVIRDDRGRRTVAVDLVVFADRTPNLDLALAAGATVARSGATLTPVVDAAGRTSVPSLFVAGAAAGRPIIGAAEADAARATGRAAAGRADPVQVEAGQVDAGRADAGQADAGQADAGQAAAEAGRADAGQADAGQADAGQAAADAGPADTGQADAGQADVGQQTGATADDAGQEIGATADDAGRATAATAAGTGPHAAAPIARGAIVCFCEDVRAWEIATERAAGYDDPELIKRRTGALTGPCQGKYCLQAFSSLAGAPPRRSAAPRNGAALPTGRPPLRPIRLGDLVAVDPDAGGGGAT